MLMESSLPDSEKIYIRYGILCEDVHGGLFDLIAGRRDPDDPAKKYNQALVFIIQFMREMFVLTDSHFQTNLSEEVLRECDSVFNLPPKIRLRKLADEENPASSGC